MSALVYNGDDRYADQDGCEYDDKSVSGVNVEHVGSAIHKSRQNARQYREYQRQNSYLLFPFFITF
jgi:hypothetical protein